MGNKVLLASNVEISPVTMKGGAFIFSGETVFSHNMTQTIGKNYLISALGGFVPSVEIRYLGIGRSTLPSGGSPAASDKSIVALSDPDPFYMPVSSIEATDSSDMYFNEITVTTYILGTPALFNHFQLDSTSLSIGEIGLFFGATKEDSAWGVSASGKKPPYALYVRDNILESRGGVPLSLQKSQTAGVYNGWACRWRLAIA